MAVQVTDATFNSEVIESDIPVLLDFWAPWCGPCRAIAPILDELSEEFKGKVKICKMNVDENRIIPSTYNVNSIPTLVLIKNGQTIDMWAGVRPKQELQNILNTRALA